MPPSGSSPVRSEDSSAEKKRLRLTTVSDENNCSSSGYMCGCQENEGDRTTRNGVILKPEEEEDSQESLCSPSWAEDFPVRDAPLEMGTPESINSVNNLVVEASAESDLGENTAQREGQRSGERNSSSSEFPQWGVVCEIGRREEMEDSAQVMPDFLEMPLWMKKSDGSLIDEGLCGHFFGIYDGHGGAEVANYCKERMHFALKEEMTHLIEDGENYEKQWERVFMHSFIKVDAELAGRSSSSTKPIVSDTVGSTAVVAAVFPSHIIIANCGDSRAVLSRAKRPIPLSVDHKPERPDEYARIERAGGKVLQWNGYRVCGFLAISRSIGDRHLQPYVIADPEVNCVERSKDDECLILASDGLWDVLSNEEACTAARKRILLWHKKNGGNASADLVVNGIDPAAQAAADYLLRLASHRGSVDNISIIVVDLRAIWKRKVKPLAEGDALNSSANV